MDVAALPRHTCNQKVAPTSGAILVGCNPAPFGMELVDQVD